MHAVARPGPAHGPSIAGEGAGSHRGGSVSLALGIGSNTAIFTLFDQVLLRLLPVADPKSLVALLSSAFGFLATLLAFLGLYGVTAFGVTRRSAEIGLRMALGAKGGSVVSMVLKEVAILALIGVGVALPLAWWLSELVQSQLYGVAPRDPWTLALATFSLLGVALAAGAVPALRASRVSPVSVLRYE